MRSSNSRASTTSSPTPRTCCLPPPTPPPPAPLVLQGLQVDGSAYLLAVLVHKYKYWRKLRACGLQGLQGLQILQPSYTTQCFMLLI